MKSDAKEAKRSKIFVVIGEVREFDTPAKAEAFLNADGAPTDFLVIRGHRKAYRHRVSLRDR